MPLTSGESVHIVGDLSKEGGLLRADSGGFRSNFLLLDARWNASRLRALHLGPSLSFQVLRYPAAPESNATDSRDHFRVNTVLGRVL
jgi:hypothetical protein